jgi:CBS domain-containing protein
MTCPGTPSVRDGPSRHEEVWKVKIREVMTPAPVVLPREVTLAEAARLMRDQAIGDVLVTEDDRLCGLVTDRDIVVRALADAKDPQRTNLGEVCSAEVFTLGPDSTTSEAVRLMRENAIRRIPVVEDGRPVGVVSIGDLAVELDERSALSDISAAPPSI